MIFNRENQFPIEKIDFQQRKSWFSTNKIDFQLRKSWFSIEKIIILNREFHDFQQRKSDFPTETENHDFQQRKSIFPTDKIDFQLRKSWFWTEKFMIFNKEHLIFNRENLQERERDYLLDQIHICNLRGREREEVGLPIKSVKSIKRERLAYPFITQQVLYQLQPWLSTLVEEVSCGWGIATTDLNQIATIEPKVSDHPTKETLRSKPNTTDLLLHVRYGIIWSMLKAQATPSSICST